MFFSISLFSKSLKEKIGAYTILTVEFLSFSSDISHELLKIITFAGLTFSSGSKMIF